MKRNILTVILALSVNLVFAVQLANAQPTNIKLLVDTPYKLAAHYLPPLVMRVLLYNEIPLKANDFHVKRKIYITHTHQNIDLSVDPHNLPKATVTEEDLIETLDMNFKSKWEGLLGRKITGTGKLNERDISFENKTRANPIMRTASMESKASIGDDELFAIKAKMKGSKKLINVSGTAFQQGTKYSTQYRTTSGTLGGYPYEMYVEGLHAEDDSVYAIISDGLIQGYGIKGYAQKVKEGLYEIKEYYGSLYIETTVTILEDD